MSDEQKTLGRVAYEAFGASAGSWDEAAKAVVDAHAEQSLVRLADEIHAMPPSPPTIRVRIAVAVNTDGDYYAEGDGSATDRGTLEGVRCVQSDCAAIHWLEADVPLPQVDVIEADVIESEIVTPK